MGPGQSTFENTLADYFRERLLTHSEPFDPPPHEDTLWYTSNLLARFGHSRQLFSRDGDEVSLRPLALLYFDAHETRNHQQRCLILRHLGDLALFLGALFPEKFARRGIGKDYFVGMGGSAYDYLADNASQNRHIYSELANMFALMLDLIARVCARENCFDATDILNLYQRWQQTGDPLLAEQLQALGVNLSDSGHIH